MFSAEHSTSHASDGCFVKGTSIYCFVISGLVFEVVAFANLDLGTGAHIHIDHVGFQVDQKKVGQDFAQDALELLLVLDVDEAQVDAR